MSYTLSYVGTIGSSYNDARLVQFLSDLGMATRADEQYFEDMEIDLSTINKVIAFALENDFDFVMEDSIYAGRHFTICEKNGFHVEW